MVISQDIIFIHIGKTGGMSCADYLLRNLRPPIINCFIPAVKKPRIKPISGVTTALDVGRHLTLQEAEPHIQRLTGKPSAQREKILAVIRNPFTLEYSYYRHLQKPHIVKRRQKGSPKLVELAQGDFKTFVAEAGYHRVGLRQEDFFLIDGKEPENLELIRFEELSNAFPKAVEKYALATGGTDFPKLNAATGDSALQALLDEETRELLYQKHRYMFDQGYYSTDYLL